MPPPTRRQRLADGGSAIANTLIGYFGNWVPAAVVLVILITIIILI